MKLKYLEHINESEVFSGGAFTGIGVGGPSTNGFAYSIYMEPRNDSGFKPNELCTDYYIQIGSKVRGKAYNDNNDSTYTGIVRRIIKNSDGSIEALMIQSKKNRFIYISPDDLILLIPKTEEPKPKYTIAPNYMVGGQLY
jgi:hypothetical protein